MHLLLFGILVDCVKIILRVDHISPKISWLENLELDSVNERAPSSGASDPSHSRFLGATTAVVYLLGLDTYL